MIVQAHAEERINPYGSEFVAQSDDLADFDSVRKWLEGVAQRHPLPEGKRWMICDETSDLFMRTATCEPRST
jgi:hypothetical protein